MAVGASLTAFAQDYKVPYNEINLLTTKFTLIKGQTVQLVRVAPLSFYTISSTSEALTRFERLRQLHLLRLTRR